MRGRVGRCFAMIACGDGAPDILEAGLLASRGHGARLQVEPSPCRYQAVTAVPEVRTETLQAGDEFLILACDGIWDVLTVQEVGKGWGRAWKGGSEEWIGVTADRFPRVKRAGELS